MIHHTIRFTVKPEVTEEEAAAAIQRMRDATAQIPAIKAWTSAATSVATSSTPPSPSWKTSKATKK